MLVIAGNKGTKGEYRAAAGGRLAPVCGRAERRLPSSLASRESPRSVGCVCSRSFQSAAREWTVKRANRQSRER